MADTRPAKSQKTSRWSALMVVLRSKAARRVFALVILSLGTALLVVDYVRLPSKVPEQGQVAERDIRASTSFEFTDWDQTFERQREAVNAVLPVFDFDSTLVGRQQARFAEAFETARMRYGQALMQARSESRPGLSDEELSEIALEFVKLLELSIETDVIEHITEMRWDRQIEDVARALVGVAMRSYIASDASSVPAGVDAVSVVRIFGDRRDEIRLGDFEQVLTPPQARQKITLYKLENFSDTADSDQVLAAEALARAAVRPNFSYNQLLTEDRRQEARDRVSEVVIRIDRGTALVREGDVITRRQVEMIAALKNTRSGYGMVGVVLALVAFSGLVYLSLYQFSAGFIRKFSTRVRDVEAIAVLALAVLAASRVIVELSGPVSGLMGLGTAPATFWYLVPFAGGAMLVRILVNSETAIVWVLAVACLLGVMLDQQVLFTLFFAISGVTAAGGIAYTKERVNVLRAGVLTGLVNAAAALLLNLVQAHLGDAVTASQPLWDVGFAFVGGILSAIMVLGLVPVFELFGFVTDYKLLELSNLNHPLLRQLMLRAPGTYHHSVTVAQLCEGAAESVGANALLTRVSCYFHDIGKAVQPKFFIENQREGPNPHDKLNPRTSARVIINHVLDGVAIAKQYKLPQPIMDGIVMHHGTGLIQYFYARALDQAGEDEVVEEGDFRYPGTPPDSRETGIMMLADRVEAACRSLRDKSDENIRAMIMKLVNGAVTDGQLEMCPLTVKELYTIADSFANTLLGIYHHRVEYPGVPAKRATLGDSSPGNTGPIITLEVANPLDGDKSGSDKSGKDAATAKAGNGRAERTDPGLVPFELTDPNLGRREPTDPASSVDEDYESAEHVTFTRRRNGDDG